MGLASYVTRRVLQLIPCIFFILVLNFIIIHTGPVDPAIVMAGEGANPEIVQRIREQYGLDQPLHVQLGVYFFSIFKGDFGTSFRYQGVPALEVIASKIPQTLLLLITALTISVVAGSLLGAYAASKHPSNTDGAILAYSVLFHSMPTFWFGIVLILVFAFILGWFPIMGMQTLTLEKFDLLDMLWHLVLPAATLILASSMPMYIRLARSSVIEVGQEDFVMLARAKGLKERTVFLKHAFRNAMLPTIQVASLSFGAMLGGTVIVETVFAWPGLGNLAYLSARESDFPVLMALFLLMSISVTIFSLISDIVSAIFDPRISYK